MEHDRRLSPVLRRRGRAGRPPGAGVTYTAWPAGVPSAATKQRMTPAVDRIPMADGICVAAGNTLAVRVQAVGTNPTTVSAKVWTSGTTEPASRQRPMTDTRAALHAAGGSGIGMYLSSTATNAPVTSTPDDLQAVMSAP